MAADPPDDAGSVVSFWRDAGPRRWFAKDAAFDATFRERFLDLHLAAARRELDAWATSADGVLALLILLDQFPRNAFRGSARMYATDALARHFARLAVDAGLDRLIEPELRQFCYLPFEHSEHLADQERSLALARTLGPRHARHALRHRDIIARFGRFPHRNALLGRDSTPAELAFLAAGGFAG
jgi:uncharacterized protein (DUF924 family)